MLNDRVFFIVLALGGVAGAWGTYLVSKWIASLLVTSLVDQRVMAVMAVVVAYLALGTALDLRRT